MIIHNRVAQAAFINYSNRTVGCKSRVNAIAIGKASRSALNSKWVRSFTSDSDRIHSTDIAFKPAESGWGANSKYSNNFGNIFGNEKNASGKNDEDGEGASTENDEKIIKSK